MLLKVLKGQKNDEVFHRATNLLKTNYGEDQELQAQRASAGKRHARRANAPAMTVEEFYERNYYLPFLDYVISHFKNHFPEKQRHLPLAFHLLPSNVHDHELTDHDHENIKEEFLQGLPSLASYDQELNRWQQWAQEMRADGKRQQLTDLLDSPAVAQFYPNVHAV